MNFSSDYTKYLSRALSFLMTEARTLCVVLSLIAIPCEAPPLNILVPQSPDCCRAGQLDFCGFVKDVRLQHTNDLNVPASTMIYVGDPNFEGGRPGATMPFETSFPHLDFRVTPAGEPTNEVFEWKRVVSANRGEKLPELGLVGAANFFVRHFKERIRPPRRTDGDFIPRNAILWGHVVHPKTKESFESLGFKTAYSPNQTGKKNNWVLYFYVQDLVNRYYPKLANKIDRKSFEPNDSHSILVTDQGLFVIRPWTPYNMEFGKERKPGMLEANQLTDEIYSRVYGEKILDVVARQNASLEPSRLVVFPLQDFRSDHGIFGVSYDPGSSQPTGRIDFFRHGDASFTPVRTIYHGGHVKDFAFLDDQTIAVLDNKGGELLNRPPGRRKELGNLTLYDISEAHPINLRSAKLHYLPDGLAVDRTGRRLAVVGQSDDDLDVSIFNRESGGRPFEETRFQRRISVFDSKLKELTTVVFQNQGLFWTQEIWSTLKRQGVQEFIEQGGYASYYHKGLQKLPWHVELRKMHVDAMPNKGTVLDYAGGTGHNALLLQSSQREVHILDTSPTMMAEAVNHGFPAQQCHETSIANPTLFNKRIPDDSIDGIVWSNAIYLMTKEEIVQTFAEIKRILKPGGVVSISGPRNWSADDLSFFLRVLQEQLDQTDLTPKEKQGFLDANELLGGSLTSPLELDQVVAFGKAQGLRVRKDSSAYSNLLFVVQFVK